MDRILFFLCVALIVFPVAEHYLDVGRWYQDRKSKSRRTESERNEERLREEAHKLAQQGDAEAQFDMGMALEQGWWGLPQSDAIAAEQGHPRAAERLAFYYRQGRGGLPQDFEEADKWDARADEFDAEKRKREYQAKRERQAEQDKSARKYAP